MTAVLRLLVWIASIVLTVLTGAFGRRWLGEVWEIALFGCIAMMAALAVWTVMEWKRSR